MWYMTVSGKPACYGEHPPKALLLRGFLFAGGRLGSLSAARLRLGCGAAGSSSSSKSDPASLPNTSSTACMMRDTRHVL